jgi:hypothetical protein
MDNVSYFSPAIGPKKLAAVGRGIGNGLVFGVAKIWQRERIVVT